jgi:fructose-bisphosphate aldolase class I
VFEHLRSQKVLLEGMILKPNIVLPGSTCPQQESVDGRIEAALGADIFFWQGGPELNAVS